MTVPTTTLDPGSRPSVGPVRNAMPSAVFAAVAAALESAGRITPEQMALGVAIGAPLLTLLATVIRNVARMRPKGTLAFLGKALGLVPLCLALVLLPGCFGQGALRTASMSASCETSDQSEATVVGEGGKLTWTETEQGLTMELTGPGCSTATTGDPLNTAIGQVVTILGELVGQLATGGVVWSPPEPPLGPLEPVPPIPNPWAARLATQ